MAIGQMSFSVINKLIWFKIIFLRLKNVSVLYLNIKYRWVTTYTIYIKRDSLYHIYTLLMPCIVLSILSCFLFILPPDSGLIKTNYFVNIVE